MDERNDFPRQNWDPDTYRTGKTRPPKRRGGLIAILLIVVILLSGISSAMGLLNIKLFHRMAQEQEQDVDAPLSFSQITPTATAEAAEALPSETLAPAEDWAESVTIQTTPPAVENIPQAGGLSLQQIYEKAIPSVVSIICTTGSGSSTGTGVVLSEDGYLVTNCHVVKDARQVKVRFTDERELEALIVGMDEVSDLAVLQVQATDLQAAEFGDSSVIRVGDLAVAIGDPLGVELRGTMTDGIISAINRDITTGGRTMTLLQTNAALNSGNSGGPLLNCYGQVIGINTMKIGDTMNAAGVEGLGFAIPSSTVKEIVDQLIAQGYVSGRPTLGIVGEDISVLYQHLYNMPSGVYISEIAENGHAYAEGIRPGDILVKLDDVRVNSTEELNTLLRSYNAGDVVTVVVYRSGSAYQADVMLDQAGG